MKTLTLRLVIAALALAACAGPSPSPTPSGNPAWVDDLIAQFTDAPVGNPPQSIWRYQYNGQDVYYVPAQCCDMFSTLYDASGNVLCAPDGGLDGRGDGKCPDFRDQRTGETLIWQDERTR
jgi:hypothetical protein